MLVLPTDLVKKYTFANTHLLFSFFQGITASEYKMGFWASSERNGDRVKYYNVNTIYTCLGLVFFFF